MVIQRISFTFRNSSTRSLLMSIKDRPVEVTTTSLGASGDTLPPMSELSTYLGDDDVLVLTADGIGIEKKERQNNG